MAEFPGTESGEFSWAAGPPGRAQPYFYPPGAYPPPQYWDFPPVAARSGNGLAVASLVIGIVALLTSPVVVGLGLGIAAVAMGLAARRPVKRGEAARGGLALAGIVLGILATVVGLVIGAILGVILVLGITTDAFNEDYQHCLGEHNGMSEYCEQYR